MKIGTKNFEASVDDITKMVKLKLEAEVEGNKMNVKKLEGTKYGFMTCIIKLTESLIDDGVLKKDDIEFICGEMLDTANITASSLKEEIQTEINKYFEECEEMMKKLLKD